MAGRAAIGRIVPNVSHLVVVISTLDVAAVLSADTRH
jgi:hypothetical protein